MIADKTSGKAPLTVNFEGNQSFDRAGGSLDFEWDIAGEASSTQADTTYTFEDPGTYRVFLTVTNDLDISVSDSVDISVLGNGTPYFGDRLRFRDVLRLSTMTRADRAWLITIATRKI